MKKFKILCAAILSCVLAFSATACADSQAQPQTTDSTDSQSQSQSQSQTPDSTESVKDYTAAPHYEDLLKWFDRYEYTQEQRDSFMNDTETLDMMLYSDEFWSSWEEMSPVIMLDGNAAPSGDVADNDGNNYTLDLCFAVPYGTSEEERDVSDWKKMMKDSKWNDFTVSEASSGYNTAYYESGSLVTFQEVHFEGSITVSASAEYFDEDRGITDIILLTVDKDSLANLPSLKPYFDDRTSESEDYTEEKICFTINSESEYFQQIADRLDAEEEVTVTVTADAFMLQWTDYGLITDGVTNGRFENILELKVN